MVAEEGDGVVVDSDVVLLREFADIDKKLELPITTLPTASGDMREW